MRAATLGALVHYRRLAAPGLQGFGVIVQEGDEETVRLIGDWCCRRWRRA